VPAVIADRAFPSLRPFPFLQELRGAQDVAPVVCRTRARPGAGLSVPRLLHLGQGMFVANIQEMALFSPLESQLRVCEA
jgi:hypothetical protein